MSDLDSPSDLLVRLAEEFADRYRRGERPSPAEYADRHPGLAERIRALFPTLVVMEELCLPEAAAPLPRRLGDYRIIREVGRGGMGVVYEAVQESLGRRVALKVLPSRGQANPAYLERFKREARAAAKLHHTNIVPVFGVGEHDGVPYYAMQFIDGRGLDTLLREVSKRQAADDEIRPQSSPGAAREPDSGPRLAIGPGFWTESRHYRGVAEVGVQAAEGLAHAHQQGLLHRDVKPANLLLDADGTVWIADFGLVKEEGGTDLTATGDIVGTLRYMAPERFHGRADARSDVYSLGLTLYELLTRQPAFAAEDRAQLLHHIQHDELPRPRDLDPRIPRDLETIILKACGRDPDQRYQTAAALAEDLRRFLADRPILARRERLAERLARWGRRNKLAAGLIIAVSLLMLSAVVGGLALSWNLWTALDREWAANQDKDTANRQKDEQLRQALYERARAGRLGGQIGQRLGGLEALAEAARIRPDDLLRDEAIACLALPDIRPGLPWPARPPLGTPEPRGWPFDDAYRIHAEVEGGTIRVRRLADGHEVRRFEPAPDGQLVDLGLSPDGEFLVTVEAVASVVRLRVWRVDDGRPLLRQEPLASAGFCWDFSPDGRQFAVGYTRAVVPDSHVVLLDLTTGAELMTCRVEGPPHSLAFHPDGRRVAVGYARSATVSLLDAITGELIDNRNLNLPVANKPALAWHPGGSHLAVAVQNTVALWNTGVRLEGHRHQVTRLSFHPDGRLLASASWDGTFRLWDASSGQTVMQVNQLILPRFSADGRWLGVGFHDDRGQLMEMVPSREYRCLGSKEGPFQGTSPDISPDGRLLALARPQGSETVGLWDLASDRELPPLQARAFQVRFGRDPDQPELFTSGAEGLLRWPMSPDPAAVSGWRFGPREVVLAKPPQDFLIGPSGKTLIVHGPPLRFIDKRGNNVREAIALGATPFLATSPDGRWLATFGGLNADRVIVRDLVKGEVAREWVVGLQNEASFSPDNRTLVISSRDGYGTIELGTWAERTPPLRRQVTTTPGPVAFSAGGRLMAVEMLPGVLHLVETATGRTVARLEDPHRDRAGWLGFTPDDGRLVVLVKPSNVVRVWDLRLIRDRLREMNLDWS